MTTKKAASWRVCWKNAPRIRVAFFLAGTITVAGILAGMFIDERFLYIPVFIGLIQLLFAITGFCPMVGIAHILGHECTLTKK